MQRFWCQMDVVLVDSTQVYMGSTSYYLSLYDWQDCCSVSVSSFPNSPKLPRLEADLTVIVLQAWRLHGFVCSGPAMSRLHYCKAWQQLSWSQYAWWEFLKPSWLVFSAIIRRTLSNCMYLYFYERIFWIVNNVNRLTLYSFCPGTCP